MTALEIKMRQLNDLGIEFTIYFPAAGYIGLKYWYKGNYIRAVFRSYGGTLVCEDEYVNESFVISAIR